MKDKQTYNFFRVDTRLSESIICTQEQALKIKRFKEKYYRTTVELSVKKS